LVLGGEHQGGNHQVHRRVRDLIGEASQRRGEALGFQAGRQGGDLGPDRERRDGGGSDDRLLESRGAGHRVAEHLGPPGHRLDAREGLGAALGPPEEPRQPPAGQPGEERPCGPARRRPDDHGRAGRQAEAQRRALHLRAR
jgi:hypothetical protein